MKIQEYYTLTCGAQKWKIPFKKFLWFKHCYADRNISEDVSLKDNDILFSSRPIATDAALSEIRWTQSSEKPNELPPP